MYMIEYSWPILVASISKDSSAGSGNYNYGIIKITLDASYNLQAVESYIDYTNTYLALPKAMSIQSSDIIYQVNWLYSIVDQPLQFLAIDLLNNAVYFQTFITGSPSVVNEFRMGLFYPYSSSFVLPGYFNQFPGYNYGTSVFGVLYDLKHAQVTTTFPPSRSLTMNTIALTNYGTADFLVSTSLVLTRVSVTQTIKRDPREMIETTVNPQLALTIYASQFPPSTVEVNLKDPVI